MIGDVLCIKTGYILGNNHRVIRIEYVKGCIIKEALMEKSFYLAFVILLFWVGNTFAQNILWYKTYGGSSSDECYCAIPTNDSGFIMAGWNASYSGGEDVDAWLLKTDSEGNMVWSRMFGGGRPDMFYHVDQTPDGGYIACGRTHSVHASIDMYVVRTDSLGNLLWQNTYGGDLDDRGRHIVQTTDGGFLFTGSTNSYHSNPDVFIVKTDSLGDTMWTRGFDRSGLPNPNGDYGHCAQQTQDGGYIIAGITGSDSTVRDYWIIKTDSLGDTLWTKVYGGAREEESKVVQITSDGGYIIGGRTMSFGPPGQNFWLLKLDEDGDSLWAGIYGGDKNDRSYWAQETSDSGYIMVGHSQSYGNGGYDIYVVKTDSVGNMIWEQVYGGTEDEFGYQITEMEDSYIIGGWTQSIGNGNDDFYLLKIGKKLISIDMEPDNPPVIVSRGGIIGFQGELSNNALNSQQAIVWYKLLLPEGEYYEFSHQDTVDLSGNESMFWHPLTLRVPGNAEYGDYLLIAYCGIEYQNIIDSSYFEFTVFDSLEIRHTCSKWVLEQKDENSSSIAQIDQNLRVNNYPNPFNAETRIEYLVAISTDVKIEVFNIQGQLLEKLFDGPQQPGWHWVKWDASKYSSGVYQYRIEIGDRIISKRMTLVK